MCTVDAVLNALSNERRRSAVCCVHKHRRVALADLAEYVAEAEGKNVRRVPAEETAAIYFSLYHTHVPMLEDAGLVSYSQDQDVVTSTERLQPLVSQAYEELTELVHSEPLQ